MEIIYTTEQNRKLFFYTYEAQLYLRAMQGERVARPLLLCNNYQSGLSSTLYNGALYYCYLNQDRSLLVRSLAEPTVLFRLDGTDTVSYEAPHLVVFAGRLLLFYIEKNQNSYSLKSHTLFAEAKPEVLPDCFFNIPKLQLLSTGTHLFVFLSVDNSSKLFRYNTELRIETLLSKEELSYELAPLLEQEHKLLQEKEQEASDAKMQLAEKEQELRNIRQSLAESEKKTHHTELLLERAKTQYAELMDVATKYREEAIKWRSKFLGDS